MKRETAPRRLHMGCGEKLIASVMRTSMVDAVVPGVSIVSSGKPPKEWVQQVGEGKR